jgi:hypothetical protein
MKVVQKQIILNITRNMATIQVVKFIQMELQILKY